jgi:endonuclease-3 related protein
MQYNQQFFLNIYRILLDIYGYQKWWPAETPFEVVIGAILTQNTNWNNVEKSISNLKKAVELTPHNIIYLDNDVLKSLIKPSGFFNQKSERLKTISSFIIEHLKGDIKNLKIFTLETARKRLLDIKGIGNETADSILLYAADMPSFVVDKYTMRMFGRMGVDIPSKYEEYYNLFMNMLPKDVELFKEYHALIVEHSKNYCKKLPLCETCPIKNNCNKIK